jgi:hypothetical protein
VCIYFDVNNNDDDDDDTKNGLTLHTYKYGVLIKAI